MDQIHFSGVCTALVTPFLGNQVNYPMLEQLLKRQIDAGIKAVVLCGTTGEAATLSDEEKLEIIRRAKGFVGTNCMIIAGSGSNDTLHAVKLSQKAEATGADALLVVSPYYNKANNDGLFAHYSAIAHAVQIPVIIYNVPGRTGQDIPVAVYKRLSKISNIIGVKEAASDITKITSIRRICGLNFSIWTGNDSHIVPSVALGAKGVISVVSNLFPTETAAMTDAALAGDFDTAASIQMQLQPIIDFLFCEPNPIPVKAAMHRLGYDCGGCRMPLTGLTIEHQTELNSFFP